MRSVIAFIVLAAAGGCEPRDAQGPQEPIRLLVREPVLDRSRLQQDDILNAAANYPDRITVYGDGSGPMRPTKYGDPALDQAAIALRDIDRPSTLEKIRAAYESEKALDRRVRKGNGDRYIFAGRLGGVGKMLLEVSCGGQWRAASFGYHFPFDGRERERSVVCSLRCRAV